MDQGLILDISDEGALLAHFRVRPDLLDRIKVSKHNMDNLRVEIMQKAHYTPYNVHLGSSKMYHDVKDRYW